MLTIQVKQYEVCCDCTMNANNGTILQDLNKDQFR